MSQTPPPGDRAVEIDLELAFGENGEPPYRPVDDQLAVMASYFEGTGRVVVDASAGTGKTTTLVATVAETIVRLATETTNPLESILVTTFGRDATAELKTRVKTLLRQHVDNGGELPQAVFRWIETESTIQTLDSVFADLLREVAIELQVPPDFTVDDQLELQQIRQAVVADLREQHPTEFRTLTQAYPAVASRAYPPDTVEEMLSAAQQNCREFGISTAEAADSLRESLRVGHGGHGGDWLGNVDHETDGDATADGASTSSSHSIPPETVDDINGVLRAVVGDDAVLSYDDAADAQQLLDHVKETYFGTAEAIEAFATLLERFEREYDRRTRRAGQFTFTDVAHLLAGYLADCEPDAPFRRTLGERFDHVFVDEFQDTSAVQCAVLRHLVDSGESVDRAELDGSNDSEPDHSANLFLIGDTKQAIYEWRSADPALFAEIIETTKSAAPDPATIPHLGVSNVRYHALTTVFRHHPDIAAAANHVFQRLFEDAGRGAIGQYTPSYVPVEPHGSPWDVDADGATSHDDSHIHVLNVAGDITKPVSKFLSSDLWASVEATRVAETIGTITDPEVDEPPVTIQATDESGTTVHRQPTPGDITLLFRSTRKMERYATVLREEYGIPAETTASGDLFEQPEIRLLIDILSWLSTPYDDESLRRLLRSPLVALSDETIRTLVAADSDPETLVDSWPAQLPDDDRRRLEEFCSLRAELGWERETSKTALIHRLLEHSGMDAIILSDSDALRRYGNIWLLTELVDEWEVDELLSYREFISRLRRLRNNPDSADPQFSVAEVADHETGQAVTLTTVHGAKGQEYPLVFLCDLLKQSTQPRLQQQRLLMDRQYGFALRPRPGETPVPNSVEFPTPDRKRRPPVWFNNAYAERFPDVTGPIWLSDQRTETGAFQFSNPLNAHLTAREAEFWRLAYVAFTRAEDHVFVGLGSIDDDTELRWSTWLAAFNEQFEPDCGWDGVTDRERTDRTRTQPVSWRSATGETVSETVRVGVDEIPPTAPEPTETVDLTDQRDRLTGEGDDSEDVPYRPLGVSASSLLEFADCPRAFQYRHVQEIEPSRQSFQSSRPAHSAHSSNATNDTNASNATQPTHSGHATESTETVMESTPTPGDLAPNEWGDLVHRLIELQLADEQRADQYIRAQPTAVSDPLQVVQSAVAASSIAEQCQSASTEWVAEYDLSHRVATDGQELRVTGTADLLYRSDGEWHLVDWKTGRQPAAGAATAHRRQLAVYAWLLAEQFDSSVETATVAYINPDGSPVVSPVELDAVDTEWVDRAITQASKAVPFDADGLEPRPGPDVCGSCPYAEHNGGPCVDDYYADDTVE